MHLESRITWEKLSLELELMAVEDPVSLIPVLIGINSLVGSPDSQEWCLRQVNFMTYELQSRATQLSESERFDLLNAYLFGEKGFQIVPATLQPQEEDLLIRNVLTLRKGSMVTLALLYLHFATELDIPVYLLQIQQHFMLKWVRSGRASYIDLGNQGVLLTETEMLNLINRSHASDPRLEMLESWKSRQILRSYILELLKIYEPKNCAAGLHICFNVLLKLDPNNLRILGRRALLRQKLGLVKEAISDLKRFFSFVEHNKAPQELQLAYFELQAILDETPTETDVVH